MERVLQKKPVENASLENEATKGQKTAAPPEFKLSTGEESKKTGGGPKELPATSPKSPKVAEAETAAKVKESESTDPTAMDKLNKILAGKGFKDAATAKDKFLASLVTSDDATLAKYRADTALVDAIFAALTAPECAKFAANVMTIAPATCDDQAGARAAAVSMLSIQLADKGTAKTGVKGKLTAVIIPRSKLMTDLPQFSALAGTKTFDGRPWEPTRGVGYGQYVAMAEENILGGACTAKYDGKTVNGTYAEGYSTATHEFAHGIHLNLLSKEDKKVITDAYKARKVLAKKAPTDADQWVDGKEGCYASMTEHEFFAQLSNAYLGTNAGKDPYTGDARHNSKEWVKKHEPTISTLLTKLYAGGSVANANPKPKAKK